MSDPAGSATTAAASFGALLAALWSAHDLADHVVQTDHQAANKASSWPAMAGHVSSYTAVQVAALAAIRPLGVRPSWRRMLAGVALSAGTHAVLDRRWPVVRILQLTGSAGFADPVTRVSGMAGLSDPNVVKSAGPVPLHGPYLADQALHHACLFLAALILAGGRRG